MISVETARGRILERIHPMGGEWVALEASLGRVLAQDLVARTTHPAEAISAMDGYAIRAQDAPEPSHCLRLIGESAAGHPFPGIVGPREAVRIFTGAVLPKGADCVIMQEDTLQQQAGTITLSVTGTPGRYVLPAGLDFSQGQTLLTAGTRMRPRQIGLAAAMNHSSVLVRRRPRVALLSTGDEVVMLGTAPGMGQVVASNAPALAALIAANGGEPVTLGIAADTRESLSAMIQAAKGCDLLVTSGGVSAGDHDLVQQLLIEHGLDLAFWKIAIRPGKPLMFGTLGGVPVIGLPGNPVAVLVCGYVFLLPALRTLLGLEPIPPPLTAILGADCLANDARQEYLRGSLSRKVDGTMVATPFPFQDSSILSGLANANGLIIRRPFAPEAKAGEPVDVLPFPDAE